MLFGFDVSKIIFKKSINLTFIFDIEILKFLSKLGK